MSIPRSMLAELLTANTKANSDIFESAQKGAQEGQNEQALAKLKSYLAPQQAGAEQAAKNKENLATLQSPQFQDQLNNGGSAAAGDLHVGADPYAHVQQNQLKGEAQAIAAANKQYASGLPKIQQVVQAAGEGLEATNDPTNPGSLGQARTLMLKAMGMNRYNEEEAKAVLPPTLQGYVSGLFNQAGGDQTPLNEVQRQNINQFFKTQLGTAKQQHDALKANAMNAAMSSPYANPSTTPAHLQGLGAPIDQMLQTTSQRFSQVPKTQGPNLTAQPNPSVVDRLKGYLGLGGASSQPPAPQQEQDPIAAELAKRAKGALQQQAQPPQPGQPQPPQGQ